MNTFKKILLRVALAIGAVCLLVFLFLFYFGADLPAKQSPDALKAVKQPQTENLDTKSSPAEEKPLTYKIVTRTGAPVATLDANTVTVLVKVYADGKDVRDGGAYYNVIKDKDGVYFARPSLDSFQKIEGADAASFTYDIPYGNSFSEVYARDKERVYYDTKVVVGADPKTFAVITSIFAKDKAAIYINGEKVEKSDPPTFKLTGSLLDLVAEDKNLTYINDGDIYTHIVTKQK